MTNLVARDEGESVALNSKPGRSGRRHASLIDKLIAEKQGLGSASDPTTPHFASWVSKIWNDETVSYLEAKALHGEGRALPAGQWQTKYSSYGEEVRGLAYLAEVALLALDRRQEEEGLRPQFSATGSIPVEVANRWLMNFLETNRDQLAAEVFEGVIRAETTASTVEDSYRILIETTEFTEPQWRQAEDMLFQPGWLEAFDKDDHHNHNAWQLRRHFLPNPSMPPRLLERAMEDVIGFRTRGGSKESFNLGSAWLLTNPAVSNQLLIRFASGLLEVEAQHKEKVVDMPVEWEWFCSHPNWSPELADLIAFHGANGCGRDNRKLYTGCYLRGASPCAVAPHPAGSKLPAELFSLEAFLQTEPTDRRRNRDNYASQEFILCPHSHPWGDLVKEVAMASWDTIQHDVLPEPQVLVDLLPGYALGRELLEGVSSGFENGDDIPLEWLKELI